MGRVWVGVDLLGSIAASFLAMTRVGNPGGYCQEYGRHGPTGLSGKKVVRKPVGRPARVARQALTIKANSRKEMLQRRL